MARGVGSDDNVMGGKEAVINVGFKDDLGNILENASKLKEVLDSVNSNFLAINSAVGITTNSMGKLASQTQRLVATTQQLRNEYQSIADASQRIGLSQSISAPQGLFRDTDTVREALGGGGRGIILGGQQEEAEGRTAGLKEFQVGAPPKRRGRQIYNELPSDARMRSRRQALQEALLEGKIQESDLDEEQFAVLKSEDGIYRRDRMLKDAVYDWRSGGSGIRIASKLLKTLGAGPNRMGSGVVSSVAKTLQKSKIATSLLGTEALTAAAAGETGLISAMGSALGPMTAAVMAGIAAYKAMDYLVKGATRYSGLTGGTGVFSNTGAAAGSETFVDMQVRAWKQGVLNMAIGPGGYQQIQEALIGAGYTARDNSQYSKLGINGMRYETTRSALAKLYGVGLQDVDQNMQLMQMVVERGNGSLTSLMGTIDNLRTTALKTNASLKVMMNTLTVSIQGLVGGMNINGGVAAFIGGTNAAAYANSQNTLLRGSGAPDYNNFLFQAQLMQTPQMQAAGVSFQNLYYKMSNPQEFPQGLGLTMSQATDTGIDRLIGGLFPQIKPGMDMKTAKDLLGKNTPMVMALAQNPAAQAWAKDPAIYQNKDAWIEFLASNLIGNPQTAAAEAAIRSNRGRAIDIDRWDRGPGSYWAKMHTYEDDGGQLSRSEAINQYFQKVFGDSMAVSFNGKGMLNPFGGSTGMNERESKDHPRLAEYYKYAMDTGQRIGFIEDILKNGGTNPGNTYFKFGNKTMSWSQYFEELATNKDLQAATRGEGDTRLLIGTKEKGQRQADINNYIDAMEYTGGGVSSDKRMTDMTQEDFKLSVAAGMMKFARDNNAAGQHLKVDPI